MKNLIVLPLAVGIVAAVAVMAGCRGASSSKNIERDSTFTTLRHPEWSRNAVIYEVNLRQYTREGTVEAFARELPRLKELGVDVLWFMPVHPISELNRKGTLGSYYAVRDYTGFNPEFGTVDEFRKLVGTAHRMGMKVLIDWVANHTGCDNIWVQEHPDWYVRDSLGRMVGPYDWTDTYKLDYSNRQMLRAMVDAMRYWVDEVGVDGFRCDVAGEVPVDFWDWARPQLQEGKPDLFMLAEASVPELQKNAFDMGYNWPMKDLFSEIAATSGQYFFKKEGEGTVRAFPERHATDIDSLLALQARQYPKDTYLMNMTSNHDLNSWEGTEFDRLGILAKPFAVLTYTLPGMPLIYTGQETGFARPFEFFEKDLPPQWEPRVKEYFDFYKALNHLKHTHPALRAGVEGGDIVRYPTANPDIYAFSRTADGHTVTVIVNIGKGDTYVEFTGEAPVLSKSSVNLFTGRHEALPGYLMPGAHMGYVD